MTAVARTLQLQRRIFALMLVLTALVFYRGAFSVFSLVKGTVILVAVVGLLTLSTVRLAQLRRAYLPVGPPVWAVAAFAGGLILSTLVSPNVPASLAGQGGRFTGLVMYGAYLLVFLYAVRLYRHHSPTHLVRVLVLTAIPVVGYGYLQLFDLDPFGWGFREAGPAMFSTLGNPNFFAAWSGIVAVLALAGALVKALPPAWRGFCAGAGIAAALAASVSMSLQGPVSFAAGGALLAVVALWTYEGPLRRWRVHVLAVLGAVGAGLVVAVLAGIGPLARVQEMALGSARSRRGVWGAAFSMFTDRPILGQGLDMFAERYWFFRSVETAVERGLRRNVDAAHSVPLDMLASGGLVLGLAYLAVLVVIIWSVVVGLRRLEGDQRILLAGFAGGWVAYQVQSVVSIDVPALAVLGWLCAGVVVALAGTATLHEIVLPGARKQPTVAPGKRRKQREPAEALVPLTSGWLAGIGALAVVGLVLALWPLSIDLVAGSAREAGRARQTEEATAAWARAVRLAPWDARYAAEYGHHLARSGSWREAQAVYQTAWEREQSLFRALTPARMASSRDPELATMWFDRALAVDGTKTTTVLKEAGEFFVRNEDADRARALYERALELYPDNHVWWVGLGHALALGGDIDGARAAFERALELNANAEGAQEGLQALG